MTDGPATMRAIIQHSLFMIAGYVIQVGAKEQALEFLGHVEHAVEYHFMTWAEILEPFRGYLGGD